MNTKAPKGVKNGMRRNYRKSYYELYNKIEEYSKELVVVSYKLTLTPNEKLWDNLILNPPIDLRDLMMSEWRCMLSWRTTSGKMNKLQEHPPG